MSQAATLPKSTVTIAGLLEALKASGFDVLYSSDLVPPDLAAPPGVRGADPMSRARSALASHHLILRSVGARRYIVTRAAEPRGGPGNPPTQAAAEAGNTTDLQQVTVFASRYRISSDSWSEPVSADQRTIEEVPGAQSDAIRALHTTPGLASNLSSRPYIRGAPGADTLVQFDGISLVDPFHFTAFQNLLSVFNPAAVQRADVYTGGFPARYGTRSAGVIDLIPQAVSAGSDQRVGASLLSFDASSMGRADRWPVDWLATARHGTEDDGVLQPIDGAANEPEFTDALGRVRWFASPSATGTLGWLVIDDTMSITAEQSREQAYARHNQVYSWIKWDWSPAPALQWNSSFAVRDSDDTHGGTLMLPGVANGTLTDRVGSTSANLRTEWSYLPASGTSWDAGAEFGLETASLSFLRQETFAGLAAAAFGRPTSATLASWAAPHSSTSALFASAHRHWRAFEAELGLRLDGQDYVDYGWHSQFSPRLNLRFDPTPALHLYGSWGVFTQAQRVDEYRPEDQQVRPDPATRATHLIGGIAGELAGPTHWRLEAYRIHWTAFSPYYTNALGLAALLPELEPDWVRIAPLRAESAGMELSARGALAQGLEAWGSYTLASAAEDALGQDVPRSWDQRNAANLGLNWTQARNAASLVLGWHSGWPRTLFGATPGTSMDAPGYDLGPRNGARWGNFFSADLHASRSFPLRHSEALLWLDVINVTDRHNECCVDLGPATASSGLAQTGIDYWSGVSVNLGFTWQWRTEH
jgi:hypothetical protein